MHFKTLQREHMWTRFNGSICGHTSTGAYVDTHLVFEIFKLLEPYCNICLFFLLQELTFVRRYHVRTTVSARTIRVQSSHVNASMAGWVDTVVIDLRILWQTITH